MPQSLLQSLKGRFPFRLGATSWIFQAGMAVNVEAVAGAVDDVELLALESSGKPAPPGDGELRRLRELAAAANLSYTVHLPLDVRLAAADEAERHRAVEACLATAARFRELGPLAWVTHVVKEDPLEPGRWMESAGRSLRELAAAGLGADRLAVENLDYPFDLVDRLSAACGTSLCLDVGHLLLAGGRPAETLARVGGRCRVVHLHGVIDGHDHRDLSGLDPAELARILDAASGPGAAGRVVTLELFAQADLARSLEILGGARP